MLTREMYLSEECREFREWVKSRWKWQGGHWFFDDNEDTGMSYLAETVAGDQIWNIEDDYDVAESTPDILHPAMLDSSLALIEAMGYGVSVGEKSELVDQFENPVTDGYELTLKNNNTEDDRCEKCGNSINRTLRWIYAQTRIQATAEALHEIWKEQKGVNRE